VRFRLRFRRSEPAVPATVAQYHSVPAFLPLEKSLSNHVPDTATAPWMLSSAAVFLAIAIPTLQPFAPGPSPHVVPLLVSGLCGCALLLCLGGIRVRTVVMAWLVAGLLSSLMGLCQYFGVAERLAPWVSAAGLGEAYANLRQRNQLATVTNIAVASLLWVLAGHWQRTERPPKAGWPLAALGALALLAAGNAATGSRIGFLQLLILFFLSGLWTSPARKRLFAAAGFTVVCYCIAALVLPYLLERYWGVASHNAFTRLANSDGCGSRRVLWANVMHLIAERPWTGWGWGELDYAHYATLYPGERFCDILDNAHNLPLHLAVELGVPIAVLLGAAVFWLVVRGAPWRITHPRHQLAWSILCVIALHSMVEYPLWYGPFQLATALCAAFLLPARLLVSGRQNASEGLATPQRIAAGVVAMAIAFIGWDYWRVSQIYLPAEKRSAAYRDDTLRKIADPLLFRSQALFAELTLTPLDLANAADISAMAKELLHYSPEPRVIEKVIESAAMLGRTDEAVWHASRYRAAFPMEYAQWAAKSGPRFGPAAH
jgi:O-antigen ligase